MICLLPALATIVVAMLTHRVALALFCGVTAGALVRANFALGDGLGHLWRLLGLSFADVERLQIAGFILGVGAMLAVIAASGAYAGLSQLLGRWLDSARKARMTGWSLGLGVFFDDYANLLINGAAMRGVTALHPVSPALLAYIGDQMATVVSLMLVSTWAAYEGSLVMAAAESVGHATTATAMLFASLPYHIFTLYGIWLALLVAWDGRWWGRRYEDRLDGASPLTVAAPRPVGLCETVPGSREHLPDTTATVAADETPVRVPPSASVANARVRHALVPLFVLVGAACGGIFGLAAWAKATASGPMSVIDVMGSVPTIKVLLAATVLALLTTTGMMRRDNVLSWRTLGQALRRGLRDMLSPALVIILSKGLAAVSAELGTGAWLVALVSSIMRAELVPVLVFLVSFAITVATGFSWSAMAIMMPIGFQMAAATHLPQMFPIVTGAVVSGSIAGGMIIPFSDTTVMAAAAFGVTPLYHVKTQAVQILVAATAAVIGFLFLALYVHIAPILLIGWLLLWAAHRRWAT